MNHNEEASKNACNRASQHQFFCLSRKWEQIKRTRLVLKRHFVLPQPPHTPPKTTKNNNISTRFRQNTRLAFAQEQSGEALVLSFPPHWRAQCVNRSAVSWRLCRPSAEGGGQDAPHIHPGCSCHSRRNSDAKPAFHGVKSAVSVARGKYRSRAVSLQMSEKHTRADRAGPSPALIKNPIKQSEKANPSPPHTLDSHSLLDGCLLGTELQRSFALW